MLQISKIAVWACLPLFAGCATGQLAERLDRLEPQVQDTQRAQALASARFDDLDKFNQMIYLLQNRVEEIALENSRYEQQIAALNAKIETAGATVVGGDDNDSAEPQPQTAKRRGGVHSAKSVASGPARSSGNDDETAGSIPARSTPPPAPKSGDPAQIYQNAYNMMNEGRSEDSAAEFGRLIGDFPSHELADNALYWLGEIAYSQKDYTAALRYFERVTAEYPAGNKVADAQLKTGFSWAALGDTLKARQVLKDVIAKFGWSPAAEKAKQKLQELGP